MDLEYDFTNRRGVILAIYAILLLQPCLCDDFYARHAGCFKRETSGLAHEIAKIFAAETVQNCVRSCKQEYFMFAGLYNGKSCLCGNEYGSQLKGECVTPCAKDSSQTCGGPDSYDIYYTGIMGPPDFLKIENVTARSVLVSWGRPKISVGKISHYEISASYVKTYSNYPLISPMQWEYSNSTSRADLYGFHPGTQYNISVRTVSKEGLGAINSTLFWTVIGDPDVPDVPKIIKKDNDKILIKLEPASNNFGPISAYRVVVIDESSPVEFDTANLESWSSSQCSNENGTASCTQQDAVPYYIAAELRPEELPEIFVVGDGQMYGNYYNAPLVQEADYHISLGVVSSFNGVTKSSYAHPTHEQHLGTVNTSSNGKSSEPDTGLVVGLSIAIGVFGFLLLMSIIGYFLLKNKLEKQRRAPDHQELSLQGPMLEVESSGYIHDAYIVEDEGPINYYDNLKKKVWNIPKNFLEVRSEVIGKGKYGAVVKGSVKQRGSPVPVSVHYIADEFCKHPSNKPMLEDFDKLIRTSPHTNVIGLIGTSEIPDALLVVLEYHPATLKDILLESRCLDQDGLSHSKDKFCSLQESHLLEISIGVARGMDHLIQKKIVHGKLCARSVAMADGIVPKICGFGLADIAKNSAPLDYTRWTGQEIFRGRHLMTKSDIWSFGCLLWEIITFGGTLFPDVPSRDVPTRVMRGVRPMRPSYVGDDLYQFMLQCWQIDLDERPNFSEATRILINMLQDSEIHLNFSTYAGFHYEPYIPELEYLK